MSHVFADRLELSDQAFGLRLAFDHELSASGLVAVVREAQEVEGLRATLPGGRTTPGGEPPELDQPGLALVHRQAELLQPVSQCRAELL